MCLIRSRQSSLGVTLKCRGLCYLCYSIIDSQVTTSVNSSSILRWPHLRYIFISGKFRNQLRPSAYNSGEGWPAHAILKTLETLWGVVWMICPPSPFPPSPLTKPESSSWLILRLVFETKFFETDTDIFLTNAETFLHYQYIWGKSFEIGTETLFWRPTFLRPILMLFKKHRKNCECCPGHYLIVDHYSSI